MHFLRHKKIFWTIVGILVIVGFILWAKVWRDPCYEEKYHNAELTAECNKFLHPN